MVEPPRIELGLSALQADVRTSYTKVPLKVVGSLPSALPTRLSSQTAFLFHLREKGLTQVTFYE